MHGSLCLIMISILCRSMPQGLQAPPEKSIAVTFHAIVPLPFWEWEDSTLTSIFALTGLLWVNGSMTVE